MSILTHLNQLFHADTCYAYIPYGQTMWVLV